MAKKSTVNRQIKKKSAASKAEILGQTGALLESSQAVFLTEYRGLTVPQMGEIRRKIREAGEGDFSVVKNTLFRRATEGSVSDPRLDAVLNGTTAATFASSDPVAIAKALSDYIASNRNTPLKIKGGLLNGKFIDAAQVDALAKVPPREVLVAQILGSLNAPLSGIVGTLDGILSSFIHTLTAVADQKSAQA